MKKILFLSPYPYDKDLKDGMISRIKSIDSKVDDMPRSYLLLTITRRSSFDRIGLADIYILNVFTSLLGIIKLFRGSDVVYCQSIWSVSWAWPICWFYRGKKKFFLDVHGVIPEEERYFQNKKIHSYYMSFVQRVMFHVIDYAVCVTQSMIDVYKSKYTKAKCKYILYFIVPAELQRNEPDASNGNHSSFDKVEVIYCGGIQKWQNVDMMLSCIKNNLDERVNYTILTGNKEELKELMKQHGLSEEDVHITSCAPSELATYYERCHYAFILRDDSVVNRVANPTKLIEYMYYGLTPIVLSPYIGDYYSKGYDYIKLENYKASALIPKKNVHNANLAKDMIAQNEQVCIGDFIKGIKSL